MVPCLAVAVEGLAARALRWAEVGLLTSLHAHMPSCQLVVDTDTCKNSEEIAIMAAYLCLC